MRLLPLLLVLMFGAPDPLAAAEPSPAPDDLVRLARKWSSKDDAIKSFEIAGTVIDTFRFHVIRLATGEVASYISSSHDGAPVVAIVNNRGILWDVLRRQVIVVTNFASGFELTADAGGVEITINGNFRPKLPENWWLVLDVPAVLAYAPKDRQLEMLGNRRYILAGSTEKGGLLKTWFDQKRPQPVERLQATTREGVLMWEVSHLRINEKMMVRFPPLPSKQQLGEHFEVIEVDGANASAAQQEALVQRLRQSNRIRQALNERNAPPVRNEMRAAIEKDLGYPIDWTALAKTDAIDANHIRKLVEVAQLSKQEAQTESAKPATIRDGEEPATAAVPAKDEKKD